MVALDVLKRKFIAADNLAQQGDTQAKEDASVFAAEVKRRMATQATETGNPVPGGLLIPEKPSDEVVSRYRVEDQLGKVDWNRDLSKGTDRLDLGMSSTNQAKLKKLKDKYPDKSFAVIGQRLMAHDGKGWFPVDRPAVDANDFMDFLGEEGLPIAGAMVGSAIPGVGTLLGGTVGGLIGYGAKEASESARGYQTKSPWEVVKEGGFRAGMDTFFGLGGKGIQKSAEFLSGKMVKPPHSSYMRDIEAIDRMQDLPGYMPHQVTTPGAMINRPSIQGASTSPAAQNLLLEQAGKASKELRTIAPKQSRYRTGIQLKAEAKAAYDRVDRGIKRPYAQATPEITGVQSKQAVNQWIRTKNTRINSLYNKAGKAQSIENPIFDLTNARNTIDDLGVFGIAPDEIVDTGILAANGDKLVKSIPSFINVTNEPMKKLARVSYLIKNLSPEQLDYEVIKQLKTATGNAIEKAPWDANMDSGAAKKLFGSLADTLNNPVGGMKSVNGILVPIAETPIFNKAIRKATAETADKYRILDKGKIRQMIQTDDVHTLGTRLGKPGTMSPEVREVLSTRPDELNAISLYGMKNVVDNPKGAVAALDDWANSDGPGFNLLFGKNREALNRSAREIDAFNSSSLAATVQGNSKPLGVLRDLLLAKDMSRADTQALIKSMGGRGSKGHEMLRGAMLEYIAEQSIIPATKTGWTVSAKSIQNAVKPFRRNGAWHEILSNEERTAVNGIEAYARLVLKTGADVGTTLEQAAAFSDLKHPSTFVRGMREIGVNRVIATMLMKPNVVKRYIGISKGAPFAGEVFDAAGRIASGFTRSIFADPALKENVFFNE